MQLTLSNQIVLPCLDSSTVNELCFEYNKNTLIELLDNFTDTNLNGALLEQFDDDHQVIKTDCITFKKYNHVEIANDVVKIELKTMTTLEKDVLRLQESVQQLMDSLEFMLFLNF